jgi:hypothetical protein
MLAEPVIARLLAIKVLATEAVKDNMELVDPTRDPADSIPDLLCLEPWLE